MFIIKNFHCLSLPNVKSLVIALVPVTELILSLLISSGVVENVLVARHLLHRPLLLGSVAISISQ